MAASSPLHSKPTVSLQPRDAGGGDAPPTVPMAGGGTGESPDEWVGPYKLLSVIGEGGFGTVWLAERREPMVQRVALKIIKQGMDSKAVVARFEQERQALAVMDHPNVARVLDGGVTATGQPYFVMEYVNGEPITVFCDRHRLTIRQRLELFVPVCEAVQHAHMKGIIHRDIKPSNVLAAMIEDRPVVKVIDFGIAKATDTFAVQHTVFSIEGQLIGTPEYMSPEQAGGRLDVDTRTDVYSLGVLLYELLSGTLPFDPRTLRIAGFAGIQRIIRESDPPRPSTRVGNAGADAAGLAESRHHTLGSLIRELRRELEWIPLKAMRKERERRYESAAAFAEDLRRYLNGMPLRAAPESRAYLARKFVKRNRTLVGATAAIIIALAGGMAGTVWQAREAAIQRDEAELARKEEAAQRARADERALAAENAEKQEKERAAQLERVSTFQALMLAGIDSSRAGVSLMNDLLARHAASLEKSGVPEPGRAGIILAFREQLARINATDAAAAIIDTAILTPAARAIDDRFQDDPIVDAQLRQALADTYRAIGRYDAAYPLQEAALRTRRAALGETNRATLAAENRVYLLLEELGRHSEAEAAARDILEKSRSALGADDPDTIAALNNFGAAAHRRGDFTQALSLWSAAADAYSRTLGDDHPDTLNAIHNTATALDALGRTAESEQRFRRAVEGRRRVLGDEDPLTIRSITSLGSVLLEHGRFEEAAPLLREAVASSRKALGEQHPDSITPIANLGALLLDQGRAAEAEPWLRDAFELCRVTLGEDHRRTVVARATVGLALMELGRFSDAEQYLREALESAQIAFGHGHPTTLAAQCNLSALLFSQRKYTEAEPLMREDLEISRRTLGPDHPSTLTAQANLAAVLQNLGRLQEAEPLFRDNLERSRGTLGDDHPDTILALINFAVFLDTTGRPEEAGARYREVLAIARRIFGPEHPTTLSIITSYGRLLVRQGQPQSALDLLGPARDATRAAFTGDNALRFARFLTALGSASAALPFDIGCFQSAEADLLEAHRILAPSGAAGSAETADCLQSLVRLYTAWDAAEPGKGYDAKAAEWKDALHATSLRHPEDATKEGK